MNGFAAIGAPEQIDRLEISCLIRATEAGTYQLGVTGIGRFRLLTDEAVLFDETLTVRKGADVGETLMAPPVRLAPLDLAAGQSVTVRLEHDVHTSPMAAFGTFFQLLLEAPHGTDDEEMEAAVALAAGSDVAVVVVGTTAEVESEGFDRTSLALPGRQDELVRKVAAANPRTVVVVNSGAPVLLPWADQVAAVLLTWFGGQEFGNALADVLLGEAEPGGRLPTTWPASEDGLPSAQPDDGVLTYTEGLFIGYRAFDRDGREPLFPFGHGRGYTTWSYDSITVDCDEANPSGKPGVAVCVEVRNTGSRPGREVVQVYASRPDSAVERPVQVAGRLRRGGRGPRRDGDRRDPAARTRLPALGRRRLDAGGGHLRPRGGLVLGVPPAHRRRHAQVGMRLTARRLNRATLARQLLLRREPLEVAEAVRRVVALQAQEAASPYLALWNRLAPFDPAALDAAFAGHEVIKATLMRITLHAVTAADYPPFHCAMAESLRAARLYDRRYTQTGLSAADADALIPHLVEFTAERRTNAECEALLNARLGADQPRAWWALRTFAPVVHAVTGGPWSFGYRPSYLAAPLPDQRAGRPGGLRAAAGPALPGRVRPGLGGRPRSVHPAHPVRGQGRPGRHGRAARAAGGAGRQRAVRRARRAASRRGHPVPAAADGDVGQRPAGLRRPQPRHPARVPRAGHPAER